MTDQSSLPAGGPVSAFAQRYARALLTHAEAEGAIRDVTGHAASLAAMIAGSDDLRSALQNPLVKPAMLQAVFDQLAARQGWHDALRRLVGVVLRNHRANALPAILAGFAALVDQRAGIVDVTVRSAQPLTAEQKLGLEQRLAGFGHDPTELRVHYTVDPALLGGLVVRVGAAQYDTSLKSRLQRLQLAMKEAA